ncbi:MAG: DUF5663 domain-containing protein [bacterium]|nr:DUF5663 domain-containing protein [bacterium]
MAMTDQEVLNANLIVALGLQSLPDEQKLQLLDMSATLVQKRAMVRIVEILTEDQRDELNALIEKEGIKGEEVGVFLRSAVSSLDDIYKQELIAVKRELIDKAQQIAP